MSSTDYDTRIGTTYVDSWQARPAPCNPDGHRTGLWIIDAGDYAHEGEADVYIEVTAEYPKDVAEFIVQAVRNEWARVNAPRTVWRTTA